MKLCKKPFALYEGDIIIDPITKKCSIVLDIKDDKIIAAVLESIYPKKVLSNSDELSLEFESHPINLPKSMDRTIEKMKDNIKKMEGCDDK